MKKQREPQEVTPKETLAIQRNADRSPRWAKNVLYREVQLVRPWVQCLLAPLCHKLSVEDCLSHPWNKACVIMVDSVAQR